MNRWVSGAVFGAWALVGTGMHAADRYVGSVEGFKGETRVAVIADGRNWLVYVCGDSDRINEMASRWWKGAASDGAFKSEEDGVGLSVNLDGDKVVGTVRTSDGESHPFKAMKVAQGARAGAYRATANGKSAKHVLSWIVDTDGFVVGCNKGNGKRVALKPAKLAPPIPKPVAKRKPKPAEDAEAEADEQPTKRVAKSGVKAPAKEAGGAEEEDAKPEASADEDDGGEKVVGKKVTKAAPANTSKKPAADDEDKDDEDEKPVKKPAKKKPVDDDDGG